MKRLQSSDEEKLAALYYLRIKNKGALVEWAVQSLAAGKHSRSLLILAGLSPQEPAHDLEILFSQAVEELGVPLGSRDEVILNYAKACTQSVADGSMNALEALKIFYAISLHFEHPRNFSRWVLISDGIHPEHHGDLKDAEFTEVMRDQAAKFLKENS